MATLKSSGGPELERALRELALRELIGRPAPQLSEAMRARSCNWWSSRSCTLRSISH